MTTRAAPTPQELLVLQHVDREGPGVIATLAQERGMRMRVLRPDQGDPLPDPRSCTKAIALVLGGPMGVNERHQSGMAWLQRELDWLRAWHAQQRPVLGICLGAQLLAAAAGGSVEALQVGHPPAPLKEVGFGAIHWWTTPKQEPLLRGLHPSETVLHWHGDRVRLPKDATLLGSSLHCPEQVFRIGQQAIGMQCHWELSGESLERWIQEDHAYVVSALGDKGPHQLRTHWQQLAPEIQLKGRRFFNNVFDLFEQSGVEQSTESLSDLRHQSIQHW